MATISKAIAQIDTTIPAGQRIISLNQTHFDDTATGEGAFLAGYGEDRIPVYNLLRRAASKIEITFTEGAGGPGDSYTLEIRINPWKKVYKHVNTIPNDGDNPYGVFYADLSQETEVETSILPMTVTARDGETVTWSHTFPSIHDIGINAGTPGGSGTLDSMTVVIY